MRTFVVKLNSKNIFAGLVLVSCSFACFAGVVKAKPKSVEEELRLKVGDETGNESKTMKAETLISHSEQEALVQLNQLIKRYERSPIKADLLFRKAELFMRQSKTVRFFELFRDTQGGLRTPTFLKQLASSQHTIDQAISTYHEIERDYPKYEQLDLVEFNHAFALQNIGKLDDAEKIYRKVVAEFPNSQWLPDCHLAMGDMDFERNHVKEALAHYDAVKKFPDSRVYPYGIYKAAWSRYNLGDNQAALKDLEMVVAYSNQAEQDPSANHLDLRKEALNDMVVFYKQAQKSGEAFSYFLAQAGEKDVGPLMIRLAKLYDHHSEFADVPVVLNQFIDRFPHTPEMPAARRLMITAYDQLKKYDLAINQMHELKSTCSIEQANFEKPLVKDQASREVKDFPCLEALWESSSKLSAKWHKNWVHSNPPDKVLATSARAAYEVYLGSSRAEAYERRGPIQFAYAELLFQTQDYNHASENYEFVARNYVATSKEDKLTHDAPYGALLAYEKSVSKGKWSDKDELKFKDLFSLYAGHNPHGQYLDDLKFKIASIVYEKEKYDEALPIYQALADHARPELAEKSQDLYLDILNLKKRYTDLKVAASTYMTKSSDSKRKDTLNTLYQEAYLSEIQKFEEAGKIDQAIASYKQFTRENPNSKWADKAWLNSLRLSEKSGYYRVAAADYLQFVQYFPKSDLVKTAVVKSAKLYEQIGALPEAAQALNRLAQIDPEKAGQYQILASEFLYVSGHTAEADQILVSLARGSDEELAWQAIDKVQMHFPKIQDATQWFAAHNIGRARMYSELKEAQAAFEGKHFESAFHLASQIVGSNEKHLPKGVRARARMIQASILENEFRSQNVNTRPDRVALVLSIKTEKLDKAQRAYQDVIRLGDNETSVQAWKAQAGLFRHYIDSVRNMSLGVNVAEGDAKAFKKELESLVSPFEEKEVEAISSALNMARKNQLRDGQIAELQMQLDHLNMRDGSQLTQAALANLPMMSPKVAGGVL